MGQNSMIIPCNDKRKGADISPLLVIRDIHPMAGVGGMWDLRRVPLSHDSFSLDGRTIDVWPDILTSMIYQMSISGLDIFHNMLTAIISENWDATENEMLNRSGKNKPQIVHTVMPRVCELASGMTCIILMLHYLRRSDYPLLVSNNDE